MRLLRHWHLQSDDLTQRAEIVMETIWFFSTVQKFRNASASCFTFQNELIDEKT